MRRTAAPRSTDGVPRPSRRRRRSSRQRPAFDGQNSSVTSKTSVPAPRYDRASSAAGRSMIRSHIPSLSVVPSRRGSVTSSWSGCGAGPRHARIVPIRSIPHSHCQIACSTRRVEREDLEHGEHALGARTGPSPHGFGRSRSHRPRRRPRSRARTFVAVAIAHPLGVGEELVAPARLGPGDGARGRPAGPRRRPAENRSTASSRSTIRIRPGGLDRSHEADLVLAARRCWSGACRARTRTAGRSRPRRPTGWRPARRARAPARTARSSSGGGSRAADGSGRTPTAVMPAAPTSPPGTVSRNVYAPAQPTTASPSRAPINRSSSIVRRSFSIAASVMLRG